MSVPRAPYPTNGITHAHQGDTVDLICARFFGKTAGLTEQVLDLNKGLAELGPILPHGTKVNLPSSSSISTSPIRHTIKLWD